MIEAMIWIAVLVMAMAIDAMYAEWSLAEPSGIVAEPLYKESTAERQREHDAYYQNGRDAFLAHERKRKMLDQNPWLRHQWVDAEYIPESTTGGGQISRCKRCRKQYQPGYTDDICQDAVMQYG